jgi:hypothetical protein
MRRVLDLDPFPTTPGAVATITTLGDDALQPELTRVAVRAAPVLCNTAGALKAACKERG